VWPRQDAQTPPELQAFMEELAAEFGLENDKEQVWQLRKQVMDALERQLEQLKTQRANDHNIGPLRKWLTRRKPSR